MVLTTSGIFANNTRLDIKTVNYTIEFMERNKARNLMIYYLWKFISGIYFVFPLTVIFILNRGISKEQVTIFLGVTTLLTALLEIPTGFIADRFSRKFSVSLGFLFNAVGFFLFAYLTSFWQLMIIGILFALNRSLVSGAMDSLIYENLTDFTDKKSYIKISSRGGSISFASSIFATIAGGYMFTINQNLPFIATGLVNLILAILIMTFVEQKRSHEVIENISIWDGVREVVKSKALLSLIILNILVGGVSGFFYSIAFHPKLFDLGVSAQSISLLDALNSLFLIIVLGFLSKLAFKDKKVNLLVYTLVPLFLFTLILLTSQIYMVIVLGLLFSLIWSGRSHIVSDFSNSLISSKNRALTLSSANLLGNTGSSVITPIYGLLIIGKESMMVPLGVVLGILTIFLILNMKINKA